MRVEGLDCCCFLISAGTDASPEGLEILGGRGEWCLCFVFRLIFLP